VLKCLVIAYGVHDSGRREIIGLHVGEAESLAKRLGVGNIPRASRMLSPAFVREACDSVQNPRPVELRRPPPGARGRASAATGAPRVAFLRSPEPVSLDRLVDDGGAISHQQRPRTPFTSTSQRSASFRTGAGVAPSPALTPSGAGRAPRGGAQRPRSAGDRAMSVARSRCSRRRQAASAGTPTAMPGPI
jgi:hypothetical protein